MNIFVFELEEKRWVYFKTTPQSQIQHIKTLQYQPQSILLINFETNQEYR